MLEIVINAIYTVILQIVVSDSYAVMLEIVVNDSYAVILEIVVNGSDFIIFLDKIVSDSSNIRFFYHIALCLAM